MKLGDIVFVGICFLFKGNDSLPRQAYTSWFEIETRDKLNIRGANREDYVLSKDEKVLVSRWGVYNLRTKLQKKKEKVAVYNRKMKKRSKR